MSNCSQKKVAILGATGHIGKNLINGFFRAGNYKLYLFARSLDRLEEFLSNIHCCEAVVTKPFNKFQDVEYDVIINCVGIGDPAKLVIAGETIFNLTEAYDNLILDYLKTYPKALYINLSSGAAYGTNFSMPVNDSTSTMLDINHIAPRDYYGIAKLNSEAKHRAFKNLNIADLRIFGFFSRFIRLDTHYFMCEVISCIQQGNEFVTGPENIIRDYVHPEDLITLVNKCVAQQVINDVFDVYSLKPVTKFEILDYFSGKYKLKYTLRDNMKILTATGTKDHYYSNNQKARKIGYIPQFTALDTIVQESRAILDRPA